jgi:hypothetical protein
MVPMKATQVGYRRHLKILKAWTSLWIPKYIDKMRTVASRFSAIVFDRMWVDGVESSLARMRGDNLIRLDSFEFKFEIERDLTSKSLIGVSDACD